MLLFTLHFLIYGAIFQGERRAAAAMSCGSFQFPSAPDIATKAARKLVASVMEGRTNLPAALSLKSQFTDTGIANKDRKRFGGEISQFLNRV
jgi:hypothetical protein